MKIKANELRLGNIVQRPDEFEMVRDILDGGHKFFVVNVIMLRDCEHYGDNWAFEGVPLSPDVLEKISDPISAANCYRIDLIRDNQSIFINPVQGGWCCQLFSYGSDQFLCVINYLHQLQNLHFALTHTEIEINFR